MTDRIEFAEATRRLVAERAGYRCSIPDCQATTIGPGRRAGDVSRVGEAAHIFSASERGPRGQGPLTIEELGAPQNCIWLCRRHARLIDLHRGETYPADVLNSYKALHEFAMARAVGAHPCPFGWIDEIRIEKSPIIRSPATIHFAKANVVAGDNGSGKTTLAAYVATAVSPDRLEGSFSTIATGEHRFSLDCRTPSVHRIDVEVHEGSVGYALGKQDVPFNPYPFSVVSLEQSAHADKFVGISGMSASAVYQAATRVTVEFKGGQCSFRLARDGTLELKIDRDTFPFPRLSAGEQKLILIRLALALAEFSANHRPTLLLLDDSLHGLDAQNWADCLDELGRADVGFQTILMDTIGASDLTWTGWQHIQLER